MVHFICGFITIAILMIVKEFQEPFNVIRLNNLTEFYLTCSPVVPQGTDCITYRCRIHTPPPTHTHILHLLTSPLLQSLASLTLIILSSFYLFRLTLCVNRYDICAFLLQFYFICFSIFFSSYFSSFSLVSRFFRFTFAAGTHNENGFAQVFAAV